MKNQNPITTTILIFAFLSSPYARAGAQEPQANVNSRYTVEDVQVRGISESRIGQKLREEMQKLVGEKFNQKAADQIEHRLREEFPDFSFGTKVQRGDKTDHVKIVYTAERRWFRKLAIERSRLVYHSKQGWSGELSGTFDFHHNAFTAGFVNSADESLERNAGLRLGYEHRKLGTDRLRLRMGFESYHDQWNPATQFALEHSPEVPGIYRNRQNFAPALAVLPWRDLEVSAGASFQRFEIQYPVAHTGTAYAGTLSVAYRHRFETAKGSRQRIGAEYTLRSATRVLDSDFVYTRHALEGQYSAAWGRHYLGLRALVGGIVGIAPLFERFSLGDSTTLRGWNKFDVAPLGGNRFAYASLEYRFAVFQVFYDTGSVWDAGQSARFKHSVGVGFTGGHRSLPAGAFLSLGVPLRMHQVTPIVTLGIRF